ncbi:glutamate--tRNA ligase [Candidatus Micrarchaeota archaeon]|nr:glutamate--tRNA ligase [Candidatus Micrarchaeota archaeon]
MDIDSIIRKHVLKNAFDYGSANAGSVVGKVIGECPDCKKDMKATLAQINKEIARVSKLSKEEIEKEMSNFEYIEKKEEKKLIELPNAEPGKVVTRFPPEPSGYPHIGHAKAAWLDFETAKNYNGKMLLRFDDTNPEKESVEYVDAIKEGLNWLGIPFPKESYTSDNLSKIYDTAKQLIENDHAYVCTCKQEEISKGRTESSGCQCRSIDKKQNFERWEKMLGLAKPDFKEGEAILRFKGDMKSLNTVMRDPTLARIIEKSHYRQKAKYRVWPAYDLAVCVMDHLEGLTHSMRTKEYELRDELYAAIFKSLGWEQPNLISFSRLNIKGAPISKRLLVPLVKEGKVDGWSDPRLPTLKGIERRGILPEAVKEFVLSFGLSKVESEPDWEALLTINRKLLDPVSKHYFFVPDPVKLSTEQKGEFSYKLKGIERKAKINGSVFIPKSDFDSLKKDEVFALKDLMFAKLNNKTAVTVKQEAIPQKKVQWVSSDDNFKCTVLVPKDLVDEEGNYQKNSLQAIEGYCERHAEHIKEGEIVQFERFGFCRLDKKDKDKLAFIFCC